MKVAPPNMRHLRRELADAAKQIAERLATRGHRTWLVGGAVRDLALGRRVSDMDLCTSALPEEIEAAFEQTIAVGKAFGTIVVVIDGLNVEVTTFRSERGYSDGRHPDAVEFGSSVEEDARRRDFTVNALFLDPLTSELVDPEGGLDDLAAGSLRAIGEPRERFREDALRLMRLARFAARYDFMVEPATAAAAQAEAGGIARVSPERIHKELATMLASPRAASALRSLDELGVLAPALPGWAALHGPQLTDDEARERRFAALEWLESSHVPSGFAVLFDPLGAERAAGKRAFEALRPARAEVDEVTALWRLLDDLEALWPEDESEVRRGPDRSARLRILADPLWRRARDLAAAFGDARHGGREEQGEWIDHEDGHLGRMGRELAAFSHRLDAADIDPPPLVGSEDLVAAGIAPGRMFGKLLGDVRELQLQGHLKAREAALAWLASQPEAS